MCVTGQQTRFIITILSSGHWKPAVLETLSPKLSPHQQDWHPRAPVTAIQTPAVWQPHGTLLESLNLSFCICLKDPGALQVSEQPGTLAWIPLQNRLLLGGVRYPSSCSSLANVQELCAWRAQSLKHAWLFCDSMNCTCPVPLSMGFSRQEYWSGLPFPPPGDLPDPGIESTCPVSPTLVGGFFSTEPPEKPPGILWANY